MVTRTIETTLVTVVTATKGSKETSTATFTLPKKYTDEAKVLNASKKAYDDDEHKVLWVESFETVSKLYGMKDDTFLELAIELNPTTRKPL